MADNFKYVQAQFFTLAGSGCVLGATSITLTSFTQINGTLLTMTDFGTKGFITLEPGNGTKEEQIVFTGVTQNANGTATLTGVSTVLMVSPYTETSGTAQSHAGGVRAIVTNTAGFYNQLTSKSDDESVTGLWDFASGANNPTIGGGVYVAPTTNTQIATKKYVDDVAIAGAPDATTSVKGIVEIATQAEWEAGTSIGGTGASLVPNVVGARFFAGIGTTGAGSDTYAITLTPAPSAYFTNMVIGFYALVANTGACTINVNALGAKNLYVNNGLNVSPRDNYIRAGSFVMAMYDGSDFRIISVNAQPQVSQDGSEIYAADSVGTDAYAVTLTPAPLAYTTGMVVRFKAGTANTGGATLNVNSLGAVSIVKPVSTALSTNDILANQVVEVVYDGTNFQMLSLPSTFVKYSFGTTTRAGDAASGSQTIAHGLGVAPSRIRVHAAWTRTTTGNGTSQSVGMYNGTTNAAQTNTNYTSGSGSDYYAAINTANTVYVEQTASLRQTATATVDATNITLAWTRSGATESDTINILWEAFV